MDIKPNNESTIYGDNVDKTKINYKNENKTDYKDFEDVDLKIICNNILLSFFHLTQNLVRENIASIIKLDIMQFSPLTNSVATIDQEFLSSIANWECNST